VTHPRLVNGRRLSALLVLVPALLLAACGRPGGYGYSEYGAPSYGSFSYAPNHYYPPPGPPDDPWGPYIREAANRYGVPEQWVRAVMKQESGGEEQAVSPVGAMGLMQVMPETYEGLRGRYGLGDDPYDPHNNILAGTAYIREMYDRFGAPGFLAAYNAGPERVDAYLAGASNLPNETVNYLAAITPNLGDTVPLSGLLATYASARGGSGRETTPDAASLAAGCDLSAAYDPAHPCSSLMRAATAPAPAQLAHAAQTGAGGCDLSAAYDPAHPCTSVGAMVVASAAPPPSPLAPAPGVAGCDLSAAYDPNHPCTSAGQPAARAVATAYPPPQPLPRVAAAPPLLQLASAGGCNPNAAFDPDNPCRMASADGGAVVSSRRAQPAPAPRYVADNRPAVPHYRPATAASAAGGGAHVLALPERDWGIQVGAFASPALARAVAEGARSEAPGQLRAADIALPPIADRGAVLYRARLVNLSASAAEDACTNLNRRQLPCVVVQPNRG